jgi:opacity protein-like surface antigen
MYKSLKSFVFYAVIVLALTASSAYAGMKNGLYVSAGAGMTFAADSDYSTSDATRGVFQFDNGYVVNAALGYKFSMPRIEGEISCQKNDFDKQIESGVTYNAGGDISVSAFMVNGYLDFANHTRFTPFITLGIGFANVDVNDLTSAGSRVLDDNDTVFAYQAGAGVAVDITSNIALDFKYRYFTTQDQDFTAIDKSIIHNEFSSHNLMIGIRYSF